MAPVVGIPRIVALTTGLIRILPKGATFLPASTTFAIILGLAQHAALEGLTRILMSEAVLFNNFSTLRTFDLLTIRLKLKGLRRDAPSRCIPTKGLLPLIFLFAGGPIDVDGPMEFT